MKTFIELNKEELANLTKEQVDAYIDITLAEQNIKKPLELNIDFADYVKSNNQIPERDLTVYKVDSYVFKSLEDAQKYAETIVSLEVFRLDYDYSIGSYYQYLDSSFGNENNIETIKVYSKEKFEIIKDRLKAIEEDKKRIKKQKEEVIEDVIDYSAVENIAENIKSKVREAIEFFATAKTIAENYEKYFAISQDEEQTYTTLYTVFGITDDEMKEQIKVEVKNLISKKDDLDKS